METIPPYIWLVIVTIGVVALAAAMVYGTMRNRNRSVSEQVATNVETKRIYEQEDRDPS